MVAKSRITTIQSTKTVMKMTTTHTMTITTRATTKPRMLVGNGNRHTVAGKAGNKVITTTTTTTTTTIKERIAGNNNNNNGNLESGIVTTNGTANGTKNARTYYRRSALIPGTHTVNNGKGHSSPNQMLTFLKERVRARIKEDSQRMTKPKKQKFTSQTSL